MACDTVQIVCVGRVDDPQDALRVSEFGCAECFKTVQDCRDVFRFFWGEDTGFDEA
ncbi:hypothetical protein GAVG_1180 [Gardnerella vaginalis ATCC 14018 = JCM 11026]|nr:hypothetical protein GAVG_1180 [Gardnerella vaginalis ATCC 14018 = JCM 11026]